MKINPFRKKGSNFLTIFEIFGGGIKKNILRGLVFWYFCEDSMLYEGAMDTFSRFFPKKNDFLENGKS